MGSHLDFAAATGYLDSALTAERRCDAGQLEHGSESDRGSERMRAVLHAEMESAAATSFAAALAVLSPHTGAIERLADALLAAPGQVLSGEELRVAVAEALGPVPTAGKPSRPILIAVNFRLTAPMVDFWVDVSLRGYGERWMAVATIAGEPEVGLGHTAHQALEAALSSLGAQAAQALMTDPQLLAISRLLRPLT
jgi:hypothetical protein